MIKRLVALALLTFVALAGVVAALNFRDESASDATAHPIAPTLSPAASIARGEYLTRAGDCIGCHTAQGGIPYAGGRGIETPFGTVFAPNLTPDAQTGIGLWSSAPVSGFWP